MRISFKFNIIHVKRQSYLSLHVVNKITDRRYICRIYCKIYTYTVVVHTRAVPLRSHFRLKILQFVGWGVHLTSIAYFILSCHAHGVSAYFFVGFFFIRNTQYYYCYWWIYCSLLLPSYSSLAHLQNTDTKPTGYMFCCVPFICPNLTWPIQDVLLLSWSKEIYALLFFKHSN